MTHIKLTCLSILLILPLFGNAQQTISKEKQTVLDGLDAKTEQLAGVARQIWELAELGYQEKESTQLLQAQLKAAGFKVEAGVAETLT